MSDNPIPIVNNSKKISQLHARTTIADEQDNSWLALAQYNELLGSYHNIAINLRAITEYSIDYSYQSADYIVRTEFQRFINRYNMGYLLSMSYIKDYNDYDSISYAIVNSAISYNLFSYTSAYTLNTIMWDHFPSHEETFNTTYYICAENEMHLITENGKNIIV